MREATTFSRILEMKLRFEIGRKLLGYLVTWLVDGKLTAGSLDFIPCLIPPVFVDPLLEC